MTFCKIHNTNKTEGHCFVCESDEGKENEKQFEQCESCSHNCVCQGYEVGYLFDNRTGVCVFHSEKGVIVDGRRVQIVITKYPGISGCYDSHQDIIFMSKKLLKHPELYKYVLDHEIEHAKSRKSILMNVWIDLKCYLTRPLKMRSELYKAMELGKGNSRAVIVNFILLGILISSIFGFVKLIKLIGRLI